VPEQLPLARSRSDGTGHWASVVVFLLGWAFLNCFFNLRYPGNEPAGWFPLPSIDVAALLAIFWIVRARGAVVPDWVRFAIVLFALLTRIFRVAEGVVERNFHRSLSLYLDVPLVPNLVALMRSTVPAQRLLVCSALIAVAVVVLGVLTWWALTITERAMAFPTHRRLFVGVLIVCGLLSPLTLTRQHREVHLGLFGRSIVPRFAGELAFLHHAPEYKRERNEQIARTRDTLRAMPNSLDRLHHADVLLIVVESYGATLIAEPDYARRMAPVYATFESELGRHGFAMASTLLTSATYGGRSWLAHSGLRTGVRTEDGLAYTVMLEARPSPQTMAQFFHAAGYQTVLVQPGTTARKPEGLVAGFDEKIYAMDLDYHGPAFNWSTMPDQYVIDFVHRRVVARQPGSPRPPLFVEYELVSSHTPWSLQPRMVDDWNLLTDGGRIFNRIPPVRYEIGWSNLDTAGEAYVTSVIYDLDVLRRYISERIDDDALIILLGDHQPSANVTHDSPSHEVPVHVISRDRSFIQRFIGAGYVPGMRMSMDQPARPMEVFLPQLLEMFSSPNQGATR
jgi:hypothetical protein